MARWPSWGGSALALVLGLGCSGDPSTVEGALSRASAAVASRDYDALFESLDERSRFSLASTFRARRVAAEQIRESYPVELQETALTELGDAVQAKDAVDLFQHRCAEACVQGFADKLGAPRSTKLVGDSAIVETVRGTTVELYRGKDGRYGLVWETDALVRERSRSAAELDFIQKNAVQYRSQRALK